MTTELARKTVQVRQFKSQRLKCKIEEVIQHLIASAALRNFDFYLQMETDHKKHNGNLISVYLDPSSVVLRRVDGVSGLFENPNDTFQHQDCKSKAARANETGPMRNQAT